MPPLHDLLAPSAICLGLRATTGAEVIEALSERLLALGKVRASYATAVVARERTMPTGLPLGAINVAVPHTDVEHVIAPALALATLHEPVPFGSMDDPDEMIPVRVVIAMALTDKDAQIDMLQAIVGLIQNESALHALIEARAPGDVLAAFEQMGD